MKRLLLLALLLPLGAFASPPVVVFGEKEFYALDSPTAAGPRDAAQQAFFAGYRADWGRQAPYEASLALVSPPAWGKTVGPATKGEIDYRKSFPGGFVFRLALESLLPNHEYILTLNGNPARAGNALLRSAVPGNPQERYYDFLIVRTDAKGGYEADLGVALKPGDYDVRCYVKDTADFKIVLYRDFFKFAVR
jgi:hypothetical protein